MTRPRDLEAVGAPPVADAAAEWFGRQRIGGLAGEERAAFEAWLAEAPEHRSAYETLERTWAGVEPIRDDPRVMALREQALRRNPTWRRWLAPLAVAACVVAAPLGAWVAWDQGLLPDRQFQTRSYSTGLGQRSTVNLPDGSTVTLNTDTVLRTEAAKGRRQLYLDRGEAFFQVAKDSGRPFVVHAAGRTVTAIGTAFEVRVDPDRFEVTLVEGKVRVEAPTPEPVAAAASPETPAAPSRIQATEMVAGTQLLASTETGWRLQEVDAKRETSWTTGQLIFLRRPLSEVVAELNRYSATKIEVADPELAAIPITGTFKPGDNEGFAAAVVSYGMARAVERRDGAIRLVGRPLGREKNVQDPA